MNSHPPKRRRKTNQRGLLWAGYRILPSSAHTVGRLENGSCLPESLLSRRLLFRNAQKYPEPISSNHSETRTTHYLSFHLFEDQRSTHISPQGSFNVYKPGYLESIKRLFKSHSCWKAESMNGACYMPFCLATAITHTPIYQCWESAVLQPTSAWLVFTLHKLTYPEDLLVVQLHTLFLIDNNVRVPVKRQSRRCVWDLQIVGQSQASEGLISFQNFTQLLRHAWNVCF